MKSQCGPVNTCGCCGGNAPLDPNLLAEKISEKEKELKLEFEERLHKESEALIERFNQVLQNEQVRSTYMLREAKRERQEKIMALRQQLECTNMAGLMYVMCSERIKSKLERLQMIEKYTNYINMLNDILAEGQEVILNLSRGYKTAARVDSEWREKMNKIVDQFQQYIYHYSGTPPEQNQYFFDLPKLLKTDAPIQDNPLEDPIDGGPSESENSAYVEEKKTWWEKLEAGCRPFVMFGDMSEFEPNQRRDTLKIVKAQAEKTAPLKWKEYVFHEMFLEAKCPNADQIKDEYFEHLPDPQEWECDAMTDYIQQAENNQRVPAVSVDLRGNMGSILKIITSGLGEPVTKANLLGARDSMEITSTTKLREKKPADAGSGNAKVEIKVGNRRTSFFYEKLEIDEHDEIKAVATPTDSHDIDHTESLQMMTQHAPVNESKMKYHRVCPNEKCEGLRTNSFTRGLPKYMREGPFSRFESTYENYEICTPEQIEILKQRMEEKKQKNKTRKSLIVEPLQDWQETSEEGIDVQPSHHSRSNSDLPPCTCEDEKASIAGSDPPGAVFKLADMIVLKQNLDEIKKEYMWDTSIEFDRFKVIGRESSDSIRARNQLKNAPNNWTRNRVQEIGEILKKHPSLLDIFQANTRC